MNADQLDWLTERVLGAVFEVTNTLGAGFLEKVYQRALLRELGLRGIRAVAEASFKVTYTGDSAGEYFADLLVEDVLVVELKCVDRFSSEHTAQCLNYNICESPAGPSVFWSIARSRKSSGSVSSRGLGFANRLRRRPWRGRYYVVCPSFVHPFPGHYTSLVTGFAGFHWWRKSGSEDRMRTRACGPPESRPRRSELPAGRSRETPRDPARPPCARAADRAP